MNGPLNVKLLKYNKLQKQFLVYYSSHTGSCYMYVEKSCMIAVLDA
jgi:hypothetical protein